MSNEQLAISNEARYRVDYTLWVPGEAVDGSGMEQNPNGEAVEYLPPKAFRRTDFVTLVQKKGNWLISEIKRVSDEQSR